MVDDLGQAKTKTDKVPASKANRTTKFDFPTFHSPLDEQPVFNKEETPSIYTGDSSKLLTRRARALLETVRSSVTSRHIGRAHNLGIWGRIYE